MLGTPHDERDPAITVQTCKWMEQYGVKWLIYQVQHPHALTTPERLPIERRDGVPALLMSHCADNHPVDTKVRFALANWDVNAGKKGEENYWIEIAWGKDEAENSWRVYGRNVAKYAMHPRYLHLNGKLVLFHGAAENLAFYDTMFGLNPLEITEAWRDEVRKATGKELYLVAVNTATQNPAVEDVNERVFLKRWGFDAFAHYQLFGTKRTWEDAMATYDYWMQRDLRAARVAALKYWPAATAGTDATGWYPPPDVFIPTKAQFVAHLKKQMQFAADNYPVTELKVPICASGEYFEGESIDPFLSDGKQLHDGFEILEGIQEAQAA